MAGQDKEGNEGELGVIEHLEDPNEQTSYK